MANINFIRYTSVLRKIASFTTINLAGILFCYVYESVPVPVGLWCQNYVVSTSMRRHHVTSCARWDVLSKIMSPLLNLIEKSMRLGKICLTRFRDYLNNSYAGYFFSGRPNVIHRNRHENPVATHSSTHKFPPVPRQPFPVPDNH